MKRVIWEFAVPAEERRFELPMPVGAQLLDIRVDPGGGPVLTALVETGAEMVYRAFRILETGEPFRGHERCEYVGTFRVPRVGHVFEELIPE